MSRDRSLSKKCIREAIDGLLPEGFGVEYRGKHPHVVAPSGRRYPFPGTPAGGRSLTNTRAGIRRFVRREGGEVGSPVHRDILRRRFWWGQTLDEVGDHYGVTREAIRIRQMGALRRMKEAAEAWEPADPAPRFPQPPVDPAALAAEARAMATRHRAERQAIEDRHAVARRRLRERQAEEARSLARRGGRLKARG